MKSLDEVIKLFEAFSNERYDLYEGPAQSTVTDALHYLKAYKEDRNDLTALRAYWAEMHKDVRQKAEVTDENVG